MPHIGVVQLILKVSEVGQEKTIIFEDCLNNQRAQHRRYPIACLSYFNLKKTVEIAVIHIFFSFIVHFRKDFFLKFPKFLIKTHKTLFQ